MTRVKTIESVLKMKFEEVYRQFCDKEINTEEASYMLHMSSRTFLRKRMRYEEEDFDGQFDRRLGRRSGRRASDNEVWSMDFMYDQLDNQKSYRLFNMIDDHNREGLSMEVDYSLPAERVIRSLDQLMEWRGKPRRLRCDNGPEYISHKLKAWAEKHEIELCYIQPGNPQQNAYIERFNRTVRYDLLNQDLFSTIEEVQEKVTNWLWHYNNERPNMALGGITPAQKLRCVAFNNSTF